MNKLKTKPKLEGDYYGEYSFEIVEVIKKDTSIYVVIVGRKDCCKYVETNYFFGELEEAETYVKEFKEEIDELEAEFDEVDKEFEGE